LKRFHLYTAAFLAAFTLSLLSWYRLDSRPPAWDETVHLHLTLDYRAALLEHRPVTTPWASVYPPLYHASLLPFLSFGIPSAAHAVLAHILYLWMLLLAMGSIARSLGRSREDGLLAAILVGCYGTILYTARRPLIDFPLTAWVTAGLALLLESDGFRRRGPALAWGLVSGLGLLMKPFYAIWMLGPLAWTLARAWRSPERAMVWRHMAGALGLTVVLGAPWYLWQGPLFLKNAVSLAGQAGGADGDPAFNEWRSWWYYIHGLRDQMGTAPLVLTVIGWLMALVRRDERRGWGFLAAWILPGYVIFSFVHNKDLRYTLPMMPALALIAVFGWCPARGGEKRRPIWLAAALAFFAWSSQAYDAPVRQDWRLEEIGQRIWLRRDPTLPHTLVSVLSNHMNLFGRNLRWTMRALGLPVATSSVGNPLADFTEFVVMKSGDLGPSAADLIKERERLEAAGRAFHDFYPEVGAFPLPDGSQARLHQRDKDHRFKIPGLSKATFERRMREALKALIEGPIELQLDTTEAELRRGRLARVRLSGGPWTIRRIPVRHATIELTGVRLNLYRLWDAGQVGLVALESIRPEVEIAAEDVAALLSRRVRGLSEVEVHFVRGRVSVRARWQKHPVSAEASLALRASPPRLEARLEKARFSGIPLPLFLLGKVRRQSVPLDPIPSFPCRLEIGAVTADADRLLFTPLPQGSSRR
jgi:hypothetical protein